MALKLLLLSTLLITCILGETPSNHFDQKELERQKDQIFQLSQKALVEFLPTKFAKHDSINPPTVYPTSPVFNPITTPANTAPTIVTVPATSPNTGFPNPIPTPLAVPSTTTPIPVPATNPVNPPATPGTNSPVSNPVTTNPTLVTPPATTTSGPIAPGQSWCIVKNGAMETALQSALDYACGAGGADCTVIQQGGSCYYPNTLQNHASYAFNSYFQKNPTQTSCDFGGTAMITNSNPSSGSCIFPNSASSTSSPVTPSPTVTTPPPVTAVPTTASSTGGGAVPGTGAPPTVLNPSNPTLGVMPVGFGDSVPPTVITSTSLSSGLEPLIGCIILVASLVTGKHVLDV